MKLTNYGFLILGVLFGVGFVTSFFKKEVPQEIFFFEVNIWIYRAYKLIFALIFLKVYHNQRKKVAKN